MWWWRGGWLGNRWIIFLIFPSFIVLYTKHIFIYIMKLDKSEKPSQNILNEYIIRPYQSAAINATRGHTLRLVQWSLERTDNPDFPTAALLEMATGSWKTFTVWKYLENAISLRDRFNRRYNTKEFVGLNILILQIVLMGSINSVTISYTEKLEILRKALFSLRKSEKIFDWKRFIHKLIISRNSMMDILLRMNQTKMRYFRSRTVR